MVVTDELLQHKPKVLIGIRKSKHFRRIEPTNRSQKAFSKSGNYLPIVA
jgi:hypothetical protein